MSTTFTKLFSSITESTIWIAPYHHRILWVSMLAMCDKKGRVFASIPGLARRAGIELAECEDALKSFQSPDKYSRTSDYDGMRIIEIDGGWLLLNYEKYREMRDHETHKEQKRLWAEKNRKKNETNYQEVEKSRKNRTGWNQAEADTEEEREEEILSAQLTCPHQKIIELYHEHCPTLTQVKIWTEPRKKLLQTRWREDEKRQNLEYWKRFFIYVNKSSFLRGEKNKPGAHENWSASLEWILKPANFVKIIEGAYDD